MERRSLESNALASLLTLIILGSTLLASDIAPSVLATHLPSSTIVGVWSSDYASSNVTDLGISVGFVLVIDINVTNAPPFNGFELAIFFDPAVLTAELIDDRTNTVFSGAGQTFRNKEDYGTPGVLRLSIVALAFQFGGGSGTLVHINFRVIAQGISPLALAAGTSKPSGFSQSPESRTPNNTMLVLGATSIDVSTQDGHFRNSPNFGPVADFFFTPLLPRAGRSVGFNATDSYDPDAPGAANKGIVDWAWDWGDGSGIETVLADALNHTFRTSAGVGLVGNFSVRLIVRDQQSALGMRTMLVEIVPEDLHDITVGTVNVQPREVSPGMIVSISVLVRNLGTFDEQFSLVMDHRPPLTPLGTFDGETLLVQEFRVFNATLDTSGLSPGTYEINANATITSSGVVDANPADNAGKALFYITLTGSSPLLLIVGGAITLAGVVVAAGLLLRRRRGQLAE